MQYLALEGGGGKGFAYVGALQLFKANNILQQLRGVAGTSAGAITALMLSLGMGPEEIENELNTTDFNSFFDPAMPRLMPQPCANPDVIHAYQAITDLTEAEQGLLALSLDPDTLTSISARIQAAANRHGPGHLFGWLAYGVLGNVKLAGLVRGLAQDFYGKNIQSTSPPLTTLLGDLGRYLAFLDRDMGLFCGLAARNYFDGLIAAHAAKKRGGKAEDYRNMPFVRHKEIFGMDLLVCGANMSTFKTTLFSARKEHTPYFPVADAVRISMSLPIVYKPYVISSHVPGWPACGTYVDGGIWNNLPLREIEPHAGGNGPWPAHTLALRLDLDVPKRVRSSTDIVNGLLANIVGAGESQVLAELQPHTVVLATEPLSLLKFKPESAEAELVGKRSRRAVSRYFGWAIDPKDLDPADDASVERRRSTDICES